MVTGVPSSVLEDSWFLKLVHSVSESLLRSLLIKSARGTEWCCHKWEVENCMPQSTLAKLCQFWVWSYFKSCMRWLYTHGQAVEGETSYLSIFIKFLLYLLNVLKFTTPCFYMALDSFWPKNCWGRQNTGYTEFTLTFLYHIQRTGRNVRVSFRCC